MSLSVNSSFNTCMYVRIHVLLNYCLPRGQGSRSIILSVLSFVWLSIFYVSIGSVSCEINPFYSYISSSSRLQPPLGLSFSHVTDFRPISCVHSVSPWVLTRLALSFTPAAFLRRRRLRKNLLSLTEHQRPSHPSNKSPLGIIDLSLHRKGVRSWLERLGKGKLPPLCGGTTLANIPNLSSPRRKGSVPVE